MNTPFSGISRQKPPRVGVDRMVVDSPLQPDKGKEGVNVRVAIFFDGTLNNRYNTTARLNRLPAAARMGGAGTSYANAYSNVAILESLNKRRVLAKKEVSIYIEGPGTDFSISKTGAPQYETDSLKGYALGSGDTGVPAKVAKGMSRIRNEINRKDFYNKGKQYIREIKIDVFGFSRGAAAARHFVARRNELSAWAGQRPVIVTINFVGLFDTVSSYQGRLSLSPNFDNDVAELGLRIGGNAKKVVHLTAGDEFRKNFSLTTIDSSIAAGVGYECQLPGAHADIGGSYLERELEERWLYNSTQTEQLVRDGWYIRSPNPQHNQVVRREEKYESVSEPTISVYKTFGRRVVRHHYQFIPLSIMRALALKSGLGLDFEDFTRKQYRQYDVPAELAGAKAALQKIALANDRAHRQIINLTTAAPGPLVRNRYLHRSAIFMDAAHDERRLPGGVVRRKPIKG